MDAVSWDQVNNMRMRGIIEISEKSANIVSQKIIFSLLSRAIP